MPPKKATRSSSRLQESSAKKGKEATPQKKPTPGKKQPELKQKIISSKKKDTSPKDKRTPSKKKESLIGKKMAPSKSKKKESISSKKESLSKQVQSEQESKEQNNFHKVQPIEDKNQSKEPKDGAGEPKDPAIEPKDNAQQPQDKKEDGSDKNPVKQQKSVEPNPQNEEQQSQELQPQQKLVTQNHIPKQHVPAAFIADLRNWIADHRAMAIEISSKAIDAPQVWNYRTQSYRLGDIAYLNLDLITNQFLRLIGLLCPRLQILELHSTFTDQMCQTYARYINGLNSIFLWESDISNKGLGLILEANPNCRILVIDSALLTNEVIESIIKFGKELKEITIEGCQIDEAGTQKVKKELPEARVIIKMRVNP